jgi:hypothetical protein
VKGKSEERPASSLLDRNNAAGKDKDAFHVRHDGSLMAEKPQPRQAAHLIHAALTPKLGRA